MQLWINGTAVPCCRCYAARATTITRAWVLPYRFPCLLLPVPDHVSTPAPTHTVPLALVPFPPQSSATIKANNSYIVLNGSAPGAPRNTTLSALDLALFEVRPAFIILCIIIILYAVCF